MTRTGRRIRLSDTQAVIIMFATPGQRIHRGHRTKWTTFAALYRMGLIDMDRKLTNAGAKVKQQLTADQYRRSFTLEAEGWTRRYGR